MQFFITHWGAIRFTTVALNFVLATPNFGLKSVGLSLEVQSDVLKLKP